MKRSLRQPYMESLMALALFGVFAACITAVLLTGAGAYRRLTERDNNAYDRRTALQYVAAKARQGDREGGVAVGSLTERDALVLAETIDGSCYETWIYCYDGYLRELFTEQGTDLAPEDGEKVLRAEDFRARMERDGLLRLDILTAAGWETEVLSLRSGEGRGI